MKISACVIVKNEEKNIGKWLENMQMFADELIVVDTGSSDKTKEIVAASPARLYEFPWINDFSAAKNFALSKARGEWIAFLDADEFFSMESIPNIKSWIKRIHFQKRIVGIMCRLLNIDTGRNNRLIGSAVQVRLFRNEPNLKYVGAIHEALDIPKKCSVELVDDIEIYHTGYSESVIQKKLVRNLEMLQSKIKGQQGNHTPRDYRYLTDCYYGLGNYEKALENAEKSLKHKDKLEDTLHHIYVVYIGCHIYGKRSYEETIEALLKARTDFPQSADFCLMEGLYNNEKKYYLKAVPLLEEGLRLAKERKMDVLGVAGNFKRFLPSAYHVLGTLRKWQGFAEMALNYYVEGLQVYPFHEGLLNDLVRGMLQKGLVPAQIIELLNMIYKDEMGYKFLANGLQINTPGGDAIYMYYARKAGMLDSIKAYQAAGHWGAAALMAGNELAWSYKCGIASALALHKNSEDTLAALLPDKYLQIWQCMQEGIVLNSPRARAEAIIIERLKRQLEVNLETQE